MPKIHIGIVKFYDQNAAVPFGFIKSNHLRSENNYKGEKYFCKDSIVSDNFVPIKDDLIYYTLTQGQLCIYKTTDEIQIPWDEILGYANENFGIYNDKSSQFVNILEPLLENLSNNEIQDLLSSVVTKVSDDRVSDEVKERILISQIREVLFSKVLSHHFTSKISHSCKNDILYLFDAICENAIVSQKEFNHFLNDVQHAFINIAQDWKNIVLYHLVDVVSSEIDAIEEEKVEPYAVFCSSFIEFFLSNCFTQEYCQTLTGKAGEQFFHVLDKIFDSFCTGKDFEKVSRILCSCSNSIPEEWCIMIINTLNALLIDEPEEVVGYIEDLCCYDYINEFSCFEFIYKNCHRADFYFFKELFIAIAVVKKEISIIQDTPYFNEGILKRLLCSLSPEELLTLVPYLRQNDYIFNSLFLELIIGRLSVDDIFTNSEQLNGDSLFGILLDLPGTQDTILSILSKNDETALLSAKYYHRFSDVVKSNYISLFNDKKHYTKLLLDSSEGTSIADVLSKDQFYINRPTLRIRSEMLVDGYVADYLELKNKGVIDEISNSCIRTSITKVDNSQGQLFILKQFGLNNDEIMDFLVKEIPESPLTKQLLSERINNTISDILSYITENYVVFDIEGDRYKGIGWEFAYKQNERIHNEKASPKQLLLNETQWNQLEKIITSSQIVVGHNIREWDYKLLKKRNKSFGKQSKYLKNTWDTMEVELLLNPLRPSFALNAENGHIAKNDVLATERLFKQQLYMILESRDSYDLVKGYLPVNLVSVIDKNADILFSGRTLSKHSINEHNKLFYKPVYQDIPNLNKYMSGRLLIIAEEESWQSIFSNYETKFYSRKALDEYNPLKVEQILQTYSSQKNIFERALFAIANDCSQNNKRLNLKSIPGIIRHALSDNVLRKFVSYETNPSVICISPEIIDSFSCDICFNNVFVLCTSFIPNCTFIKNRNEQIIDIIEEQCDYSIYTKEFPISPASLVKLGIKAEPYKEYWISQPVPKEFVVLSRLSKYFIIEVLKAKYPEALFWNVDDSDEDKLLFRSKQLPENDDNSFIFSVGEFWAKKLDLFNKICTRTPKILIVNTDQQAESAHKYLGIPYAHKDDIKKEFDKAVERAGYYVIIVLQDLLDCDIYELDSPLSFIFIDKALLFKEEERHYFELVKKQLIKRLSLFGKGSKIIFLDDYKHTDEIPDEHIAKAEACFCQEDKTVLTNKDLIPLLNWIKNKYSIESYRGLQEPAIKKVIEYDGPNKNFLTILPTGGGKSVIFQGPILYKALEKQSKKLSLVITPLQALMEDQVKELIDKGFDSSLIACINANTNSEKKRIIINNIKKHKVCLLYISPERLMNRSFFYKTIRTAAEDQGIDSIIFDEAHCITAWGMDFRSDYILALRKCLELQKVHKSITIQMFTATLPWQSKEDLKAEIKFGENDCNILPTPGFEEYYNSLCPIRDHIELHIKKIEVNKEEANSDKLKSILENLDDRAINNLSSGRSRMLVFTYSRSDAEESAEWLKEHIQNEVLKKKISYFHARIDSHEKERRIRQFKDGQILILCSTKAFGLGMNIPNVHYLFHLTPPTFIEDYLQEVGRAARKTEKDNYVQYSEAFPIENGKREPVKAICYYSKFDIDNRLERIQRIFWEDIHDSFEEIKKYVSNFKNPNGNYIIPVDLLASKEKNESGSLNKSKDDDLIEKFQQCLGWLSRSLNRISIGFRCPDSYDLGYDSNHSGISDCSQLYALINYLKENNIIQDKTTRIILQANSIIGNSSLGIDSIEDLESIIDDGVRFGVFSRDYMHINVSLKNKKYLKEFIEEQSNKLDILSILCNALNERTIDINNFNLDCFLDESLENCNSEAKKKYIKSIIKDSWEFFVNLNQIYTTEEIENNCVNLVRTIYHTTADSVSWSLLENSIDAKKDTDKLKLFLFATSELSFTTKGTADTDFIEISILNNQELDENIDAIAKEEINNFYSNKQSRAGAMCGLIEEYRESEDTKRIIREYSACPADNVDNLEIVARSEKRLSARKGLEITVARELNDEQRTIYNLPESQNINVIAGAGSGKTRLLIYRALKLIHAEGNKEQKILILTYNRAVRDEVEKRMDEYSRGIGSPNNDLRVFTFHGYASICIPELQDNHVDFDVWERTLLQHIKSNPESYRNRFRHILIDEFQDVTTTRLEIIKSLLEINTPCNAFVIGDMFQSIYGYEKKKDDCHSSIEPLYYYRQLEKNEAFQFSVQKLTFNYRSYQAIINTAQMWFNDMKEEYMRLYDGIIPKLVSKLDNDEYTPKTDDKGIIPCMDGDDWKSDFYEKILSPFIQNRRKWSNKTPSKTTNPFSSIGILFRTNSDVQEAFLWLKEQEFIKNNDIEVRIQGSDIFYSSTREFFFFEKELIARQDENATEDIIKEVYAKLGSDEYVYDKDVLDVVQKLAIYLLKSNGDKKETCKELAWKIIQFAGIERNRLKETLDKKQEADDIDDNLKIIVSTIHRVKGLEFDATVIPASKCSIGFGNDNLNQDELNMEERRLMYVAFSRAKRMLFWYKGDREEAILSNNQYAGQDGMIYANDGQSKVDTAYLSISQKYEQNNYIKNNVKIGDKIYLKHEVFNYNGDNRERIIIIHIGSNNEAHHIGNLSRDNKLFSILRETENMISGYYVKSVNVFSYQDEIKNRQRWCQEAIDVGYVYYIDYYGCANINN